MLAAIFSSYGNGTKQDRFIPVSTALLKKKQLDGIIYMYACMHVHAGAFVHRRCRIDHLLRLLLYLSFQLRRVCFPHGLAFSQ